MAPQKPTPPSHPWFILWFLSLWTGIRSIVHWAIGLPRIGGRLIQGGVHWAIEAHIRPYFRSIRQSRQRQRERRRRWWRKNGPLKPIDRFLALWGIRPSQWRRWFRRSSLFLFTCGFTLIFTGVLGWFLLPALAAPQLKIEPLTWDFVGLDSNKPETQGPNTYIVGARVCNVGDTAATNVEIQFVKDGIDSAYTFINLQGTEVLNLPVLPAADGSANATNGPTITGLGGYVFDNPDGVSGTTGSGALYKTKYRINFTPTNCFDAYYNFDVTRSPSAWHTTQRYYIEARAEGTTAVRTPRPRQIYIEQLISQSRNYILSFTCDAGSGPTTTPAVEVGDVFSCTAIAHTATAYPQLTFNADFPNIIFQIENVTTSYTEPPGYVNSAVYADGCGWVQDPTDPRYHKTASQCEGESQYTDQYEFGSTNGAVGETIETTYTVRVLGTGKGTPPNSIDVTNIILDNSGGSYHYNADLGVSPNLVTITVGEPKQTDLRVQKSHTGNFTPGTNSYTVTITDSGDDREANGTPTLESIAAKGPIVLNDTLPTGYTFVATTPVVGNAVTGADSTNWDCTLLNSNTAIQCFYDPNGDNVYDDAFPDATTETLTFNVVVDGDTAGVNSINTVSVTQGNNNDGDYDTTNNTDTDPTILVNAANLVLTKDDTDTSDSTGFNPSETPPAPDPTIVAGQQISYDFTVTNSSGTVTAEAPIVLTDSLPTGLTYASDNSSGLADWSCAIEGQNITCTYSQDLAPGTSTTPNPPNTPLTLVVDTNASGVTSGSSAEITNTATVTSPTAEANLTDNTSSDNFQLTLPVPDLTIRKTDFNSSFVYDLQGGNYDGSALAYRITIENVGVVATTGNIEIRENLPGDVVYTSHTGTGPDGVTAINWDCTTGIDPTTANSCVSGTSTGGLTFTYSGSLAPGDTAQLDLVVNGGQNLAALPASPKTNNVSVFNASDGNSTNNNATEDTPVITGSGDFEVGVRKQLTGIGNPLTVPTCNISPDATSFGTTETCTTTAQPGEEVQYTITVQYVGTQGSDAAEFNMLDFIPDEIDVETITCTLTAGSTVKQGSNYTDCNNTTPASGNNAASYAGIEGYPAGTLYSIYDVVTVPPSNTGNGDLVVVDATSNPPQYRFDPQISLAKGGGELEFVVTGKVKSTTDLGSLSELQSSIANLAVAPLTDSLGRVDTNPLNNTAVTQFGLNVTDLSISKTDDVDLSILDDPGNASFVAGAEGTYVLRVSNGDTRATIGEINVKDDLPDEFEVLYAQGSGWNCTVENATDPATATDPALNGINNNIVTCSTATTLNGGDTSDITIAVRPIAAWISAPETFTNLAQVSTPGDNNVANNGYAPGTDTSAVDETAGALFGYEDTQVVAENVDLAITKASSSTFSVGQTAAYNLTVTNLGPTVATASATDPIIITDILPAGLSFQSATGAGWTCTSAEVTDTNSAVRDKVRCLRESNMAVNTPSNLSINVFVDGDVASSITNTAYVDVAPADFTGDNAGLGADSATHPAETTGYATDETSTSRNIHSLTRPVTLSSDLSVTKVATSQTPQTNPPQFVNEATGTYTITVTNNGPSDFAGPVLVNEDLAASILGGSISGAIYTFKSFSGTGWTCTDVGDANPCADGDTTLQFSRTGALAAGSSSSFTLDVNLSNATSPTEDTDNIDNTVTIDSATLTTANDAVSANNSATAIVDVESNTAVLTITKDDDDGSRDQDGDPSDDTRFVTGGEGSYFLIVTNNGPAAAQNVQIAENSGFTATNLPSGLTYKGYALTQNWRCTSSTATTFTCDYGQWTDTDNDGLVGEPGEDTFDDTVAMPAGTTSGLELIVSIDANATVGTLTNTVSANADNATQVTASEPTIIVEPADLAVTKTGVDTIDAVTNAEGSNTPATYTITVTNNGPGAAEGDIYLTDYLPDGLVYYSGAPQPTTNAALGDGTWTVISYNTISNQIAFRRSATLANGASSTIEVPVEVAANAPTIARNFVRVSSVTTPEPDYNTSTPDYDDPDDAPCDRDLDNYDGSGSLTTQPVNNCAVKATTITSGLETTLLKKQPATDDGTIDTVDISASGFNTLIPFTIEVTNPNTTTDVGNVIIQDTLPETLTYSSITAISAADSDVTTAVAGREFTRSCRYASDTRVLTCNLGTVDASETVAITLEVTPNVSGLITNTAGYLSGGSNTDSESVNILNPPNANTLSGTVFEDAGANGGLYINGTDTPIQNITVNLYRDVNNDNGVDAGDILLASTASAADGTYSFETNLTGEFVVAVDTADPDLPSTTFTTPAADPRSYGVTLTAGANVANNDFGVAGGAAPSLDFGDAPDTYATLLASGGPRHTLSSTLYLGASQPDAETDGQLGGDAGAGADGDDTSGSDDEASVTPGILITNASSYSLDFTVHNTTGSNATLWGWIDFDQNGTFEADEVASTTVANGATTAQLTWATGAPAGFNDLASATAGTTYGRFRLSRDAGITASTPGGAASDGEVEDYPITVTAPGSPNLLLVKRITRLLEKGSSSIVNYTSFVEDGSSSDDNDPNWPGHNSGDGSNTYTVGQTAIDASPGDRVEYTIYFLNTGSGVASNVKICDALSQYLTYIPNTYDAQSANADGGGTTNLGIELNTGGSSVYMTGLTTDAPDRGALVEAGVEPTGCVNPDLSAMTAGDNPKGTITVDLGNVDASAGSGSPNTSYGYIRFQTIVD